jgi:hypothetical protein
MASEIERNLQLQYEMTLDLQVMQIKISDLTALSDAAKDGAWPDEVAEAVNGNDTNFKAFYSDKLPKKCGPCLFKLQLTDCKKITDFDELLRDVQDLSTCTVAVTGTEKTTLHTVATGQWRKSIGRTVLGSNSHGGYTPVWRIEEDPGGRGEKKHKYNCHYTFSVKVSEWTMQNSKKIIKEPPKTTDVFNLLENEQVPLPTQRGAMVPAQGPAPAPAPIPVPAVVPAPAPASAEERKKAQPFRFQEYKITVANHQLKERVKNSGYRKEVSSSYSCWHGPSARKSEQKKETQKYIWLQVQILWRTCEPVVEKLDDLISAIQPISTMQQIKKAIKDPYAFLKKPVEADLPVKIEWVASANSPTTHHNIMVDLS